MYSLAETIASKGPCRRHGSRKRGARPLAEAHPVSLSGRHHRRSPLRNCTVPPSPLSRTHLRRLRQMFRSSGWPCQDPIEIDLLGAGLIERLASPDPGLRPDTIRVTDAGIQALALAQAQNRQALGAHEALVRLTAQWLVAQGRLAWTGLSLLSPEAPAGSWGPCRPDVFSLRISSLEHALEPTIHEIKVSRADLLGDLRQPGKRGAYFGLAQRVWYVLGESAKGEPIADPAEIPAECGVLFACADTLTIARAAPAREARPIALPTWLALARAQPLETEASSPQQSL